MNSEIANRRKGEDHSNGSLSGALTQTEMAAASKKVKDGKAQGLDQIAPELIINCGALMLKLCLVNSTLTVCHTFVSHKSRVVQMSVPSWNQRS